MPLMLQLLTSGEWVTAPLRCWYTHWGIPLMLKLFNSGKWKAQLRCQYACWGIPCIDVTITWVMGACTVYAHWVMPLMWQLLLNGKWWAPLRCWCAHGTCYGQLVCILSDTIEVTVWWAPTGMNTEWYQRCYGTCYGKVMGSTEMHTEWHHWCYSYSLVVSDGHHWSAGMHTGYWIPLMLYY